MDATGGNGIQSPMTEPLKIVSRLVSISETTAEAEKLPVAVGTDSGASDSPRLSDIEILSVYMCKNRSEKT